MNTNMIGFRMFSKNICVLVILTKVALALEGLISRCAKLGNTTNLTMNLSAVGLIVR